MSAVRAADAQSIEDALNAVRTRTLRLLAAVPDEFLKRRVHSFYSPVGWHFGHVGRTEEYWVCHRAHGRPVLDDSLSFLFADLPDNPKDQRVHLPSREQIVEYLLATRVRTLQALREADLNSADAMLRDGFAWDFAVQHECQHQETIAEMLQLICQAQGPQRPSGNPPQWRSVDVAETIEVPGGEFEMGTSSRLVYDNEREAHTVQVADFLLDRTPITAHQWSRFIDDGGYRRPDLWDTEGWNWRESEQAQAPEYWFQVDGLWALYSPNGSRWIEPNEPASSLSWFEANAYACWTGRRLPNEEEWEYAATGPEGRIYPWGSESPVATLANFGQLDWRATPVGTHSDGRSWCGVEDLAGGVWEWTSSAFLPYAGFQAFPYEGYSQDHMDGRHRVCRGGSWSTAAPILRRTFRNWYVPSYRQGFLGVRLAG